MPTIISTDIYYNVLKIEIRTSILFHPQIIGERHDWYHSSWIYVYFLLRYADLFPILHTEFSKFRKELKD